jgi:hypothetical protein
MLTAAVARGQIHQIDVTQMNSQFATGTSSATFGQPWNAKMPTLDQSVNGQRITMGMFDTKMSALNGMQAPTNLHDTFSNNHMLETKMMDQPQMEETKMDSVNGEQSTLSHYTDYDEWQHPVGPSKYTDAYVLHSGEYNPSGPGSSQELSLQDINRYAFRSSNSSEPGLPVTHAGSGDDASAGGSLVNTPALFNFGDGSGLNTSTPTSQVHSGGMVAPQMVTPGGDVQPMEPTRDESSSSSAPMPSPAPVPQSSSQSVVPGSASGPVPNMDVNHNYAPLDASRINEVQLGQPQIWVRVEGD